MLNNDSPLIGLLDAPDMGVQPKIPDTSSCNSKSTLPSTLHSHVNRLLDRVAKPAGVEVHLSSHSFRRGGAQFANGSEHLTARWIFDRGAWNVSTTNKGFGYVFNTLKEDHKVAKVLSGQSPFHRVRLADLSSFDTSTRLQIQQVQSLVFASCSGLASRKYNIDGDVLDILMAYLILQFPLFKGLSPNSPAVVRLESCLEQAGCSIPLLLSWSAHLAATMIDPVESVQSEQANESDERKMIRHQASVINHFIDQAKRQDERLDAMEAKLDAQKSTTEQIAECQARPVVATIPASDPQSPPKCRRKASNVPLRAIWYEWYTSEPRLWVKCTNKQKRSDSKLLVAYLKLFLDSGFKLDDKASAYRDDVMSLALLVEERVLAFLSQHGSKSKGANAVLKMMRSLHRTGKLNGRIVTHRRLIAARAILDPSPAYTQDVLDTRSE
ncbi:hypothetical protein Ae201684P_004164 [Aphanomyces euteiches]|uniref:Uncharacterized protein n=1 Tax=Aphanomyces euteiches TaxID=100861 RepID=A0A6G0W392_9STRA|nr:hypothetical protein Ae201684_019160 [Aphanomyces euteiches]KAF0743928.1 hypothetical protein Ae201684_001570 [Aphanomyces euteiches]KAH9075485.1 hypothetical protein Ae201684P_004164 [Aphanomyces euteiches]